MFICERDVHIFVYLTCLSYHTYSSYSSYLSYFLHCTYFGYYAYCTSNSSSNIWFWEASSFLTTMSCLMNRMDACQCLLRQKKGLQRRLQVVVREQLGPQLGNKAMMEWEFSKESVAELVTGRATGSLCWRLGFKSYGGTWKMNGKWCLSLGRWMISSFCLPVIFGFLKFRK